MKGTKTAIAIIFGIILAVGIACGGTSEPPKVNVDVSYNGSEVALAADDLLVVTLDSNPGSTGLSWNLSAISDSDVIQYMSNEYIGPETPMPGRGGQEVWTFKALDAGTATISMKYNRPTVPQEVYNTFNISVTVE